MRRKRFAPEKIISMLREAEVGLSQGLTVGKVCSSPGDFRANLLSLAKTVWWNKISQAKRMKELERENGRLKKAVAELTLDKLILRKALEGNY